MLAEVFAVNCSCYMYILLHALFCLYFNHDASANEGWSKISISEIVTVINRCVINPFIARYTGKLFEVPIRMCGSPYSNLVLNNSAYLLRKLSGKTATPSGLAVSLCFDDVVLRVIRKLRLPYSVLTPYRYLHEALNRGKTPLDAMKRWYENRPHLFVKRPCNLT